MSEAGFNLRDLITRDPATLNDAELHAAMRAQFEGTVFPGDLPIEDQRLREKSLDSPSFFMTEVIDAFYKKVFERVHYHLTDEVFAPYLLGEEFTLDGVTYDPKEYLGLIILLPRTLYKSSVAGLMAFWVSLYRKIRLKEDARIMYVHQVIKKAVKRGEVMRAQARFNEKFRRAFPEFKAPPGSWDTMEEWRWPCFDAHTAAEFSFTAYGESSDKTGGHHTDIFVDDYETENSVTTPQMIESSWQSYEMMDNLKDLGREFTPWVVCGTPYHWQGVNMRVVRNGGYIVYKVPAHEGSPKALFDLCEHDPRTEDGRRRIKLGIQKLNKERADDLNFPNLYTWEVLYQRARAGRSSYGGQQLLNPTPEGDRRFDHAAIDDALVDEYPKPGEAWAFLRCDPAIGVRRVNDECALSMGLIDWRGWRYCVDGWAGRERRPSEIGRKLFGMARRWQSYGYKVVNIGIEAVAYQEALAQLCRDGVPEREASEHGEAIPILKPPCPVRSIVRSSQMKKFERILEMEPPLERRELKIYRKNPIAKKIVQQMKNFPHDRDDVLDAVHDLWEGVLIPSREHEPVESHIHKVFKELLRQYDGKPKLLDTHGVVALSSWN